MADTVMVLTANGGSMAMDVPAEGTQARELFDAKVASGHWRIGGAVTVPAPETAETVAQRGPEGTIDEIVAWVRQDDADGEPTDGWPARAAEALAAEQSRAEPRKSLVKLLTGLVGQEVAS